MAIAQISNGESGSSVRGKLNNTILETNYLDTGFFPKIDLVSQSGYYANADSAILTSSGTLASFELLTLEEGRTYTVQNFNSGLGALSYAVYAFDNAGVNGVSIGKNTYTIFSASAFAFTVPSGKPKIGLICFIADQNDITLSLGSTIAEADTAQIKPESLANANFFEKINNAYFDGLKTKLIGGVFRVYAQVPFDTGTQEPNVGDTLVGATSGASYSVIGVEVSSGSFAGGDAAGVIIVDAASNYLSTPYSSGENLQISAVTVAVKTATAASGRWFQIGGAHVGINIDSVQNDGTGNFKIFHSIGAVNVIAVSATVDETFAALGYQVGGSIGLTESVISPRKLQANLSTGNVTGAAVDFTDLNNAVAGANIWIFGIMEV